MSDQRPSSPNGAIRSEAVDAVPAREAPPPAAPRKSLREVAEAAWEDVVENAPDDTDPSAAPPEGVDRGPQPRDESGRFVARPAAAEPGEADGGPTVAPQPRPADSTAPQPAASPPQPGPAGVADGAPANWNAEDRATFAKLTPEGQAFLLRRHGEMESDYQRRVQANALSSQFVSAVAPIFQDPDIAGSLQQQGVAPIEAIVQWAQFHKRAVSPNMMDRVGLIQDLAQRVGVRIDPAAFGQPSPPGRQPSSGFSPTELADPAIRYVADYLGNTTKEVSALRQQLQSLIQGNQNWQAAEAFKVQRANVDSVATEKGADGNLVRPYFDEVIPQITVLMRADPQMDMRAAYDTAVWMVPEIRERMAQDARAREQKVESDKRAAQAARLNVRTRTVPVVGPAGAPNGGPKGLRASIEASADEVGI